MVTSLYRKRHIRCIPISVKYIILILVGGASATRGGWCSRPECSRVSRLEVSSGKSARMERWSFTIQAVKSTSVTGGLKSTNAVAGWNDSSIQLSTYLHPAVQKLSCSRLLLSYVSRYLDGSVVQTSILCITICPYLSLSVFICVQSLQFFSLPFSMSPWSRLLFSAFPSIFICSHPCSSVVNSSCFPLALSFLQELRATPLSNGKLDKETRNRSPGAQGRNTQ